MPDGSIREGKSWLTTPMDVAKEISQGLANNALISKVWQNEHDSWQKLAETISGRMSPALHMDHKESRTTQHLNALRP